MACWRDGLKLLLLSVVACSSSAQEEQPRRVWVIVPPSPALGISADELAVAARKATDLWKASCQGCSLPELAFEVGAEDRPVRRDGVSVVRFQTGRWCPESSSATVDCYDRRRVAIAHVYARPASRAVGDAVPQGEIDVRINAVHHDWEGSDTSETAARLQMVLVHEIGHLLGLAHSCGGEPGTDGSSCDTPEAKDSVMYPYPLEAGHEHPASPTRRDTARLQRLYPPTAPTFGCSWSASRRRAHVAFPNRLPEVSPTSHPAHRATRGTGTRCVGTGRRPGRFENLFRYITQYAGALALLRWLGDPGANQE